MRRLFLLAILLGGSAAAQRFLHYEYAREVVDSFLRAGEKVPEPGESGWDAWIREQDRATRARVERGVEDSISNLILYGSSFTSLPRLGGAEEATNAAGELLPAAARRVDALLAALSVAEPANERLRMVREFLKRRNLSAAAGAQLLSSNLRRHSQEQRAYARKLREAGGGGDPGPLLFARGTLYADRGLSFDTSLLPNYAIEDTLRVMIAKGALRTGGTRRIGVIGPGLDFADKRDGYDFHPLQTIQPYALIETALKLGLAPAPPEVVAFDLNPMVLAHLRPAALQLARDSTAAWNEAAVAYWERFGELIGRPAAAAAVPEALRGLLIRAVSVRPGVAAKILGLDMDVVTQTLDGEGFDLIVATNVLVYYDRFHQALAMASIAHMLRPGGVFLANHVLPAQRPAALEFLGRRSVAYSAAGAYGDDVVVYRRR